MDVRPADLFTSPGKVTYAVTNAGLVGADLAGRPVLSGTFGPVNADGLLDASDVADKIGSLRSAALYPQGRRSCRLTQQFERATVVQFWEFTDTDAAGTFWLTNTGTQTIRYPAFGGLTAEWPARPAGAANDASWNHWYLQAKGRAILTPSYFVRLRCSYLAGGGVGVAVLPMDLGDERNLIWWKDTPEPYTRREFVALYDRPLGPNRTLAYRLTLRVSDTEDFRVLLQPYKDRLPPAEYTGTPDLRPIIEAGVEFGPTLVRPDNPRGYNDDNGTTTWRRLDKPESIAGWRELIIRANANGFQGVLWWQPGGVMPGMPVYMVDSHCVPPDVLPQYTAINRAAREAGLRVGSLLRPAELQYRRDATTDGSLVFRELTGDVETILRERVTRQQDQGAGDFHYLDSFGTINDAGPDAATAAWLRRVVGPTTPLYAEACSDLLSRYCGALGVWNGTGWTNYSGQQWEILRWLRPTMPTAVLDQFATMGYSDRLAWAAADGSAPLVLGHEIP